MHNCERHRKAAEPGEHGTPTQQEYKADRPCLPYKTMGSAKLAPMKLQIAIRRLSWLGKTKTGHQERLEAVLDSPRATRGRGRPRLSWKYNIKEDVVKLEKLGITRSGLHTRPKSIRQLIDSRAFIRRYTPTLNPLHCAICNKGYKCQGWLDRHLAKVHGNN